VNASSIERPGTNNEKKRIVTSSAIGSELATNHNGLTIAIAANIQHSMSRTEKIRSAKWATKSGAMIAAIPDPDMAKVTCPSESPCSCRIIGKNGPKTPEMANAVKYVKMRARRVDSMDSVFLAEEPNTLEIFEESGCARKNRRVTPKIQTRHQT
jgi:hypothetical protein